MIDIRLPLNQCCKTLQFYSFLKTATQNNLSMCELSLFNITHFTHRIIYQCVCYHYSISLTSRLQPSKAGIPDNPGSRPPRDPSAPATTLSRVIFILQSQTRPRPELSSSFSPSHDLVQSYLIFQ